MSVKRIDQAYFYHDKRTDLEPDNPAAWLSKGVNRWSKAYRLQNRLSRAQRLQAAKESESALLKASELDPKYPEPYSWLSVIYQSVLAKIDPDRAQRYIQDGQMYIERYKEAREAEAERQKLAQELILAYQNEGDAVKRKENTHRMAEANRAFAHFAW